MTIQKVYENFQSVAKLLQCPRCGAPMTLQNQGSFICQKGHCYDLSSKNYVNFVPNQKQAKENYDRELFENRRKVFEDGFYQPLVQALREIIFERPFSSGGVVLDAGCGEGYYSAGLLESGVRESSAPPLTVLGVDIVRDAVLLAAKRRYPVKWMVADLARLPLKNQTVDCVLDILTPANYAEFQRVLKPGGIVVKVIPGENYLREIREGLSGRLQKESYSSRQVLEYFERHMRMEKEIPLAWKLPVDSRQSSCFLQMTPMTFHHKNDPEDQRRTSFSTITIDVKVLVGTGK